MIIPVLTVVGETYMLDTKNVLYYERTPKRAIIFHTQKEKYLFPRNIGELQKFLCSEGFERNGKNQSVNLNKICALDVQLGKVYFNNIIQSDTKQAILSRSCMRKAKIHLREKHREK